MFRNLSDGAKGAWCMIIGALLLTSQDAISKWLTTDYHAGEILFYRGFFSFIPIAILVAHAGSWRILGTRNFKSTMLRAILGTATSISRPFSGTPFSSRTPTFTNPACLV